jgi:opacity protein-like surface antigen
MRLAAALAILAVTAAARADSVTNEIFVDAIQASGASPRWSVFTDSLRASFDLGEDWTVSGGASLTLLGTSAPLGESGSAVSWFNAGVDWSATDNLTLGLTLDLSPKSTQYAGTVIGLRTNGGAETTTEADLRSQTSYLGAGVDVSWDTLGVSNLEWSFDLGLDFAHYAVDQSISAVRSPLTPQQIRQQAAAYCAAHPRQPSCAQGLQGAVNLDFERISATVLATLFLDTDVALSGDWYFYNQDPAEIGYFGLASQGRGANLPIAPLQYLVRPEVLHRFGDFSAKAWVQAGEHVAGTGYGTAGIGVKLQYKFTKTFRTWVTASGQRDVDALQNVLLWGTVSMGAGYRW